MAYLDFTEDERVQSAFNKICDSPNKVIKQGFLRIPYYIYISVKVKK